MVNMWDLFLPDQQTAKEGHVQRDLKQYIKNLDDTQDKEVTMLILQCMLTD